MTTPAPSTGGFAVGRRSLTVHLTAVGAYIALIRVLGRHRRGAVAVSCLTRALR